MKKKTKRLKRIYSSDFKAQAIELAKEIEIRETTEKLEIENQQSLATWVRRNKKMAEDSEFKKLQDAKAEIKRLKKSLK